MKREDGIRVKNLYSFETRSEDLAKLLFSSNFKGALRE